MATYSLTQTAKTNLAATITLITTVLNTINTDASAPYATADLDGVFSGILNGYNSQFTKAYNELVRLEKNLSAG